MPTDSSSLLILGLGAALLVWLVVSLVKRLLGLALLAALALGAYMLWTNPALQLQVLRIAGLA